MIGKPNVIGSEMLNTAGMIATFETDFACALLEKNSNASTGAKANVPAAIVEKFINIVEYKFFARPATFSLAAISHVMPKIAPQIELGWIPNHINNDHVNCEKNANAPVFEIAIAGS